MYYDDTDRYERLLRLYENKCGQAEQARASSDNPLRYQILKAEADAIKAELELSAQ